VTTLDDFRRVLNANPEHTDALLVLADWCDDNGAPYGAGYRCLGALRLHPWISAPSRCAWSHRDNWHMKRRAAGAYCLPVDWFLRIPDERKEDESDVKFWRYAGCPFVAFEMAAKAFCLLGDGRRAELLAGATEVTR
jgi:hypothetical protein